MAHSGNHLVLNPEEVRVLDLIHILFSSDIEKRKFVECPEGTKETLNRRWLIFVSILVQKMLQSVSKPLAGCGSAIEQWLNLLKSNRGIARLALNYLRGKVIVPDRTSAAFMSFNGFLDTRIELDESIRPGDSRYLPALSMMASKLSYENKAFIENVVKDNWKMHFVDFYDFWNAYQEKATTQAFMFQDKEVDPELIVVAFRGTEPFDADAWSSDFDLSWYEIHGLGKVHGGFMKALGLHKEKGWPQDIDDEPAEGQREVAYYAFRRMLREALLKNEKTKFIVTGHSLGGALAILFPSVLALHEETLLLDRLEGVYTFGQPRVGDEKFTEFVGGKLAEHNVKYFRFVYGNDIVPRLPYDDKTFMFKHFGTCIYCNSFYTGEIVPEEPNKNYFSPLWAIPKIANASWEMIRSFTIRYTRGKDYTEGGLLRIFRMLGLVVAGVPAHCPQDYVNATRFIPSDLYLNVNRPPAAAKLKEN